MTYQQPSEGYFRCDICGKPIAEGRSCVIAYPATMKKVTTLSEGTYTVAAPLATEGVATLHFHLSCLPALLP